MEKTDTTANRPHDLLSITLAYNRGEITFEEWMRQTAVWAEWIIEQEKHRRVT